MFYIIALRKIYEIFSNTIYEINKKTVSIIAILIIFQILFFLWCLIVAFYESFIETNANKSTFSQFELWHNLPILAMIIITFIVNSHLIILYITKLRKIISNDSQNMIDIMIKHTILFGFAIFCNELYYITLILNQFIFKTNNIHSIQQISYPWYIFIARTLQNMSIIITLYLSFKSHHKIYTKLCTRIHKFIMFCCLNGSFRSNKHGNSSNKGLQPMDTRNMRMGRIDIHNIHNPQTVMIKIPNDTPLPVDTPTANTMATDTPIPAEAATFDDLHMILEQDLNVNMSMDEDDNAPDIDEHAVFPEIMPQQSHSPLPMPKMHKGTESAYDDNHNVMNLYSTSPPRDVSLDKFKSIVR